MFSITVCGPRLAWHVHQLFCSKSHHVLFNVNRWLQAVTVKKQLCLWFVCSALLQSLSVDSHFDGVTYRSCVITFHGSQKLIFLSPLGLKLPEHLNRLPAICHRWFSLQLHFISYNLRSFCFWFFFLFCRSSAAKRGANPRGSPKKGAIIGGELLETLILCIWVSERIF